MNKFKNKFDCPETFSFVFQDTTVSFIRKVTGRVSNPVTYFMFNPGTRYVATFEIEYYYHRGSLGYYLAEVEDSNDEYATQWVHAVASKACEVLEDMTGLWFEWQWMKP